MHNLKGLKKMQYGPMLFWLVFSQCYMVTQLLIKPSLDFSFFECRVKIQFVLYFWIHLGFRLFCIFCKHPHLYIYEEYKWLPYYMLTPQQDAAMLIPALRRSLHFSISLSEVEVHWPLRVKTNTKTMIGIHLCVCVQEGASQLPAYRRWWCRCGLWKTKSAARRRWQRHAEDREPDKGSQSHLSSTSRH